ncbi:OB-fold nucleic acid binding domain protein [Methanobrevibacter filiformis]|uniref:tRNA(Ile2) 2-agmatinylcytidine synthetase TiaS n=2 Tax=Methanobrevibacter filiformis TaxID=55758 RepID=A0A166AJ70_9EURY|nr:tRNA(Ile)(2)-agmatinylcytidine synthase [Methanobrevibacter filiformis]KZX12096.1 OB-fold nucleic acid binding domain protein [Methanobrevibacter filiformis]
MCTTYLASIIINELKENGINIEGNPHLIRLNPFARYKTRGNGAVSFKIAISNKTDINKIKEIVLKNVKEHAMFEHENTNPGVVFYDGEITDKMIDYAFKTIYSLITIKQAEKFANEIGAEIHKFKKGRGIIGSIAAIACPLLDYTYELISYRVKDNYGKKRKINKDSVKLMDKETFPETFENIDGDYIAIEPRTPCPVLYGIRGESVNALEIAKGIVEADETIDSYSIFKTNQHTDMHLRKIDKIANMEKYGCYIVEGIVDDDPHVIEGGHLFFTLKDESGEIEAAAYEPTKDFRKIIKELKKGDHLRLYGGIGCGGTFNIEKIKIISLIANTTYQNPTCNCGKRMTSAGKNKGFKCKKCGFKLPDGEKIAIIEDRNLKEDKFYETPVSARRHLSKPLIRMNINR